MGKFKVGDKVRVSEEFGDIDQNPESNIMGKTGVIKSKDMYYRVLMDDLEAASLWTSSGIGHFREEELELVNDE